MNENRYAYKVGLFAFGGVALLALLILNFSKGTTLFKSVYKLRVVLPNAAGLRPTADVMMAGVPIGKVSTTDLALDGKSVDINVSILGRYKIRKDARFNIDSLGFLGDQYVEVSAPEETNTAVGFFEDGDTVMGEPNFNMMEAVHSVSGVIDQVRKTVADLDQAITNINASALSTNSLARLARAVSNLDLVSDKAVLIASSAQTLLQEDAASIGAALTNFQALSGSLTNTAGRVDQIVLTNQAAIQAAVSNLAVASDQFKQVATDLQAGKGPVGSLLKDEQMTAEIGSILTNANAMTAEFSTFGYNLNQHGIWAMLWKPKHKNTNDADHH